MEYLEGCDICGQDHLTEGCPIFFQEENTSATSVSRARLTLPGNVQLINNEQPRVVAKELISGKTKLGPYEAKKTTNTTKVENLFLLKIFSKDQEAVMLDTSSEYECNWLCFIETARNADEHNCIAVQIGMDIFFVTMRDIYPKTELRVWYAPHYAKKMSKSVIPDGITTTLLGKQCFDDNSFDSSTSSVSLPLSPLEEFREAEICKARDVKHEKTEAPKCDTFHTPDGLEEISESTKQILSDIINPKEMHVQHPMNARGPRECRRCGLVCGDVHQLAMHVKQHLLEGRQCNRNSESTGLEEESLKSKWPHSLFNQKDTTTEVTIMDSKLENDLNSKLSPQRNFQLNQSSFTTEKCSANAENPTKLNQRTRKIDPLVKAFLKKSRKKNSHKRKGDFSRHGDYHRKDFSTVLEKKEISTCTKTFSNKFDKDGNDSATIEVTEQVLARSSKLPHSIVDKHTVKQETSADDSFLELQSFDSSTTEDVTTDIIDTNLFCKICNSQFVSGELMAEHKKKLTCEKCFQTLSCKRHFEKHSCRTLHGRNFLYVCKVCGRNFKTQQYMERHERGHKANFQCEKCKKQFMHLSTYKSHNCKDVHEDEKREDGKFYCEFCGKGFKTKQYLLDHMPNHTGEFHCEKCGLHYARKLSWVNHISKCNPEILLKKGHSLFQCSKCPKVFAKEISLINHEKVHRKDNLCSVCKVSFESSLCLERHNCKGPKPERYECEECGRTFKERTFLLRHLPFHTGEFTCVLCTKVFERKESLIKHMIGCNATVQIETAGKITCTVCKKVFKDGNNFKNHYKEHTHPLECDKCGSRFMRRVNLEKHTCINYQGQMFQCSHCPKKFKTPEFLKRHQDVHKNQSFPCERCGKIFRRIQMWKIHMCVDDEGNRVLIHRRKGGKEIKLKTVSTVCTVCGKSFHNVSNLNKHMKRHFEKTEKCDKCGMMFHEPAGLKAHKENIHGSRTLKWECEYCGKKMKCRNSLYTHRRTFHNDTSVVYQCSDCGKHFKSKAYLIRHVETHKNVRPLFCNECPKNFKNLDQLKKHKQWHVNGNSFECDFCNENYSTESELKRHGRKRHAGLLFCCNYCNIYCAQKDAMLKHLAKCHSEATEWKEDQQGYVQSLVKFIQEYADKQDGYQDRHFAHSSAVRKEMLGSSPCVGSEQEDPVAVKRSVESHQGQVIIAEVQLPDGTFSPTKQTIMIQTTDHGSSPYADISEHVLEALQQITTIDDANKTSSQSLGLINNTEEITVALPHSLHNAQEYVIIPQSHEQDQPNCQTTVLPDNQIINITSVPNQVSKTSHNSCCGI